METTIEAAEQALPAEAAGSNQVITMRELLEAGVHFGHQTRRWNPKMKPYIFQERNGIYIIDLSKTIVRVREVYEIVKQMARSNKVVLFVGTKKQAQDAVKEEAERCGTFFVNQRWLGGTLTNFATIQKRIARLRELALELPKLGGQLFHGCQPTVLSP